MSHSSEASIDGIERAIRIVVAFQELVECEHKPYRRATELVTVALKFLAAVVGRNGTTVDSCLAELCKFDVGSSLTGHLVPLAAYEAAAVRQVLAPLLGMSWSEPTLGSPAAVDSYNTVVRRILLGQVVYAHWRKANPLEPLQVDANSGSMGNMWGWVFLTCRQRNWCFGPPPHDNMNTIELFVTSYSDEKRSRDVDRDGVASESAFCTAAASPVGHFNNQLLLGISTSTAEAVREASGASSSPLPQQVVMPAMQGPPPRSVALAGARASSGTPTTISSTSTTSTPCTSCAFLREAHTNQSKKANAARTKLRAAHAALRKEKEGAEVELRRERADNLALRRDKSELNRELMRMRSDATQRQHDASEIEHEFAQLRSDHENLQQHKSEIELELEVVKAENVTLRHDKSDVEDELVRVQTDNSRLQQANSTLDREVARLWDCYRKLHRDQTEMESNHRRAMSQLENELDRVRAQNARLQQRGREEQMAWAHHGPGPRREELSRVHHGPRRGDGPPGQGWGHGGVTGTGAGRRHNER